MLIEIVIKPGITLLLMLLKSRAIINRSQSKVCKYLNWKNSTSLPLGVEVRLIGEAEDSESSLNFVIGAFIFSILFLLYSVYMLYCLWTILKFA